MWRGRRGPVLLGPTEHRVALFLEHATRHGEVSFATSRLELELGLTRSEAYRIAGRLRVLGLFGIANDRGGARGGRRWWRTSIEHDGPGLDPLRHRVAWARVKAAARSAQAHATRRLAELRDHTRRNPPLRLRPPAERHSREAGYVGRRLLELGLDPVLAHDWGVT